MRNMFQRFIVCVAVVLVTTGSTARSQVPFCERLSFYNAAGTTKAYVMKMPSHKWGIKMTPNYMPNDFTIDTVYIGFGLKKNSASTVKDTIEVFILENNPPTFTELDKDVITLSTPFGQKTLPDDLYMLEIDFNSPPAHLTPGRTFWLAYRFRGPANDTVRTLFKTPAADSARSVVINANGTTVKASIVVAAQIPTPVDLYAEANLCYPNGVPVELSTFTADLVDGKTYLHWSTASETQNFGFEIERVIATSESGMSRVWQRIGFVPGNGTTTIAQHYSFIDPHPDEAMDQDGFVTYRLRQIDLDGTVNLSHTQRVQFAITPVAISLGQNYPNPVSLSSSERGITIITMHLPNEQHVALSLSDAAGRLVSIIRDEKMPAGVHPIRLDLSSFPPGMYRYTLTSGSQRLTRKLLITR